MKPVMSTATPARTLMKGSSAFSPPLDTMASNLVIVYAPIMKPISGIVVASER
jgi:hypothetical protein